ncbi:MAG: oligosaccharide flippase family protein [Clostridia bacterium]|nr:oligosaccharide flippase family protein [Clostridia bacterium]
MISRDKQVKLGAVLSYFGVFFGIVTGLIYNPWMIRTIGDADYGLYTLAMSLINIFVVDFGLSMAAQRFVSKYRAENNQAAVDNIVGLLYKLYIIITIALFVVFTVLFFFVDAIYAKLTAEELEKFRVLYIMVAIYSVTSFPFIILNGILSSYEKFVPLKTFDLIYKVLSVLLTAMALLVGLGVYVLVVVNIIGSVTVTVLRIFYVKKYTPVRANWSYRDSEKIKELFGFSIWASVSIVTARLLLALGPSILGVVAGSFEIAVFGYAVSMEGYIYAFVNAINGFFMPQLSRINANGERAEEHVLDLLITVGRFILILFALIFVGFAMLGEEFITLLVGADYVGAYYCVLLICGYGLIAYPQQIANTYVVVKNRVKERALISLASFVLYIALVFVLGKMFGAIGVSISIFSSLAIQTLLMNILYRVKLKIKIGKFFKACHFKMLPGLLVFAVMSFFISIIPIFGWLGFLVKMLLIVGVYIPIVWVLILNKFEKEKVIKSLLRK